MKVKDLKKYPNLYNLVILKFYFVRQQPLEVLDEIELNLSNYEKDQKQEEKYFTIKYEHLLSKHFLSKVNSSSEKELADIEDSIIEILNDSKVSIVDDYIKGFSAMVGAWKAHLGLRLIKIQDQGTCVDEYFYYSIEEKRFYFLTLKKDFSLGDLFSAKFDDLTNKIEKVFTVFKSGITPEGVELDANYQITDIIYPKYADELNFSKCDTPLGEIKLEAPLLSSTIEDIKKTFLSLKIIIKDQKVFVEYEEKSTAIKSINSTGEYKKRVVSLLAGKFLNKFSQVKLTSLQIEAEINLIKSQLEPPEIDIVSGYDIAKYYNGFYYSTLQDIGSLRDSCMRYDRCQRYLGIYVRNPNVKLLILRSKVESDKIIGRAILWQNVECDGDVDYIDPEKNLTVLDRFYGPTKYEEFIKDYALSMGWLCKNKNSAGDYNFLIVDNDNIKKSLYINSKLYVKLEYADFELYPYMDTFKDLGVSSKSLWACSSGGLDNTNGSYIGSDGDRYTSGHLIIDQYGSEHPDKTEEELKLDILNAFNYGLPLSEQKKEYYSDIELYFSESEGKLYNNSVTGLCAVNIPTCEEINSINKVEIK